MMPLTLTTLRCPDGVAPEHRTIAEDGVSIGRGTESDWVLPDPGRVLSKRHCRLTARGDAWSVTDTSANGTYLNGNALDPELPHALRDRDRLAFGAYEFEVRFGAALEDEADAASLRPGRRAEGADAERLTSDPFAPLADGPVSSARPSVGLPLNFDELNADDHVEESPYAASDHTPDLQGHFQPPRPSLELLPEDWDLDDAPAPVDLPAAAPPQAPLPEPAAQSGFAAFAAGAGVKTTAPADANEALQKLGAAFRAMVSGLRRIMIARATIKGEFRIEQTMIRATGNNPLKFSADDDDALAALLGIGRQGGMAPENAIAEALRDMRQHELAVTAAMQVAVRDVLAELEPGRVMRKVHRSAFGGLFGRHKQAGWDAYAARHAEITRALADEFDSVFGKSFVRAYESALASIAAQDPP